MRTIVVGMGVQGQKRKRYCGSDYVVSVDPQTEADFKDVRDVPLSEFDAALLCVPDGPKADLAHYLLSHRKHVLVEKPLVGASRYELNDLERLSKQNQVICYTAYNHRFEPHFVRMKNLIESKELGSLYNCRIFYGNGTARLVRNSIWRDRGGGVFPDLGSHLLDLCKFWFGSMRTNWQVITSNCFENFSPDHVIIASDDPGPRIELEMTLCMWRNEFTCDLLAEKGSAHISSLCKWGPSTFSHRNRILPSGRPTEFSETLIQDDPTWQLEYDYFKSLIIGSRETNLETDIWINNVISKLAAKTP